MLTVKSCWTPCFWHNNIVDGTVAVSIYSFLMSVCIITYSGYVLNGGDSSQLWLPFFETNLNSTTVPVAIFVIFFFSLLILGSGLLVAAVFTLIRGFFIPWLVMMGIVILFQACFGLWLVFGYYIYLEMVFASLCNGVWMFLNIYCVLVVNTLYKSVSEIQSPDIEYLHTY